MTAREPTTPKTVPYDVAEQLCTTEERSAYLKAWLIEAPDDMAGITRALRDIARAQNIGPTCSEK